LEEGGGGLLGTLLCLPRETEENHEKPPVRILTSGLREMN